MSLYIIPVDYLIQCFLLLLCWIECARKRQFQLMLGSALHSACKALALLGKKHTRIEAALNCRPPCTQMRFANFPCRASSHAHIKRVYYGDYCIRALFSGI
jgi:hypothetical protein